MAEETTAKDLATTATLPQKTIVPVEPGPATAQALKKAPEAVKRSMPMALSITIGILLAGVVGWLFQYLMWFILVLYLCFVAATIFEAPVQWLKRHGIRRGMAAVIVMLGSVVVLVAVGNFLGTSMVTQMVSVRGNLEKAPDRINQFTNNLRRHFIRSTPPRPTATAPKAVPVATAGEVPTTAVATQPAVTEPAEFDVGVAIANNLPDISTVWSKAMWGVEAVSWLVIMFFIVLYMLIDGADHLKNVRRLIPKHSRLEATKLFNELAQGHRGWALASLSNVVSASILTSAGLYFLGVPGALILGVIAGFGELIPNIGPLLGAVPALLLTLLADPDKFFYVLGMFVIVQTVQSYTISPMMLKFSVELPVLVTIVSVLVFGMLFGFLGILVAIPLVADLVVLWQYANRYLEKDAEDYDAINAPAAARLPMAPDNTHPSRLQKLFRRGVNRANAAAAAGARARGVEGAAPAEPPVASGASGLNRLDEVERRAGKNPKP